jgi:hypothetical protein
MVDIITSIIGPDCMPRAPSDNLTAYHDILSFLPDRVWYLSNNGLDMWCRRPYGFFFSTSEAAAGFARDMAVTMELTPVGIDARELVSDSGLEAMRLQNVTRLFLDPSVDPGSGEVFGAILRLADMN